MSAETLTRIAAATVRLLVAERDAAVAQRDALAGAVREERRAEEAHNAAAVPVDPRDLFSAMMDMMRAVEPSPAVASLREAGAASLAARAATDALLTATPVAMVRASVVREYLATADAYDDAGLRALEDDEVINDRAGDAVPARAALDAALAAAGGV